MGVLREKREVLSILSHACQQHVSDMAELVDKPQIVCPLAKVDAFIENANKNLLADSALSAD